jgi:hypothetical protein
MGDDRTLASTDLSTRPTFSWSEKLQRISAQICPQIASLFEKPPRPRNSPISFRLKTDEVDYVRI